MRKNNFEFQPRGPPWYFEKFIKFIKIKENDNLEGTKNLDKGLPDFWKIEKLRLEKSNQSNTMQNIPFGISKNRTPITHKKMSVEHSFLSVEHSMKNDLKKGFYFFHFQIVAKKKSKNRKS